LDDVASNVWQAVRGGTSNALIWAVHTDGLLKGYHGHGNRGHLALAFDQVGCCDATPTGGHGESVVPPYTCGSVSIPLSLSARRNSC